MYMSEEDEIKIYHKMCKISKICKNYFYERKCLPNDGWSIDSRVYDILKSSEELKKIYDALQEKYPVDNSVEEENDD